MITDNENKAENKKQMIYRYDINRPRPRYRHQK